MTITTIQSPTYDQDSMDYSISIEIKGSLDQASRVLFDFKNYSTWNSILELKGNDKLIIGEKFKVKFKDQLGKSHKFKAKLIRKEEASFVAQQNVVFGWVLKATHHFVLEEIDSQQVRFTQHFELGGWLGKLMKKQILESLIVFEQMNKDLKTYIEQN